MVLKSDGAGLYATKDLALAKRKFDEFGIDQSIYVVDAAQTLHFKQVFKTLELMGYERAKHCVHIPYGQVVLPSGKMSSRTGTVIMFSQLKELLANDVYTNFLAKYDEKNSVAAAALAANAAQAAAAHEHVTPAAAAVTAASHVKLQKNQAAWSSEELARAQQAISVATIKYGMLNHDVAKDIVFVLEEWTARSGNTGVYMLYAYSRIQSIVREVKLASGDAAGKVDFSLLSHESERTLLLQMHDLWDVLERTVEQRNPSTLCNYLFDLSKSFSSWYEVPACSVNNAASEDLKVTRVEFVKSIAAVIKLGLNLLGIQTLERM
jgi:arginyl-tRNA synthetase